MDLFQSQHETKPHGRIQRYYCRVCPLGLIKLSHLAEYLRDILFPFQGKLFTGMYKDRNLIYGGMINAINKEISQLERELPVDA
jgi:hypothetical protein